MKLSEWSLKSFQFVLQQTNVKAEVNNTLGAILFTGSRIFGNKNILIKYWILVIRYCHDTLLNTLQVDKKYLDEHKTWFILFKRQFLYLNVADDEPANADTNAEMPMPRFPNGQSLSSITYYFSMHLTLKSRKSKSLIWSQ